MMRRLILLINVLFFLLRSAFSQGISGDSLYLLVQSSPSLEVIAQVYRIIPKLDFRSVYEHKELKPILVGWLERDWYVKKELEEIRYRLASDTLYQDKKLEQTFRKEGVDIEEVRRDPERLKQYRNSILDKSLEAIRKNKMQYMPDVPNEILTLLSLIAYPEAYQKIHQYWLEEGKKPESRFFMPMLNMLDPDAIELYDKKIRDIVKTNGESVALTELYSELTSGLRDSYGIRKAVELLKVDGRMSSLSDREPGPPLNCRLAKFLVGQLIYYDVKRAATLDHLIQCEELDEFLPEIKKASERLAMKHEQNELYWRSNLPYEK